MIKDKLYNYFVKKNGRVWYEYERYVREHMEEHHLHRFQHIKVLIKLNWFYRVKKGNTPYLYWDVPLSPVVTEKKQDNKVVISKEKVHTVKAKEVVVESESNTARKLDEYRLMKSFLKYDVISFDVFDTLLFRPFSDPYDAFILLQEKYGLINFEEIRKGAEKKAFEKNKINLGIREITLKDIYEEVHRQTSISVEEGIYNEIQLEKNICYANDYLRTVFRLLKEQGKTIIAVSDMYLPRDVVEELLKLNGFDGFDDIYVSCEFGYGKNDGLFVNVKSAYKGKSIIHIGDNRQKDFEAPQKEGIDAYLYRSVEFLGKNNRAKGLSGIISSAYKGVVNSELYSGSNKYSLAYEYGFIYGGIYILGFANWIANLRKKYDIDKVLFLARDGYIVNKVYRQILGKKDSEYVFWSRLAGMRICAKKDKYTFILDSLRRRVKDKKKISISRWLEIMGLESLEAYLSEYALKGEYPLVEANINKLERLLDKKWNDVIEVYDRESMAAKMYFEKIIGDSEKILLVDVGWQGQSMLMLKWLINEHWKIKCNVDCAMVASYPNDETANQVMLLNEELNIYAFSLQHNKELYRFFKRNNDRTIKSWFEFFTQAPHPTFERFCLDSNGMIQYKFGFPEVENYEFINMVQEGIYHFCELYCHRFKRYPFMLQISGADALIPFTTIMEDVDKLRATFKGVNFPLDTFSGAINVIPRKATDYI